MTAAAPLLSPVGRPLAFRLTALVLSILLPLGCLGALLIWRLSTLDRERADFLALQIARSVAGDLDREIDGSIETLLGLATSPSLQRGDLAQFHRQALDTLAYRHLHALLRTPDGQQVLNTRMPFGANLPQQELAGSDREVVETRRYRISDLVVGGVTKAWVLGLSVPVVIDDKVAFLLTMSIDPEHIQKLISQSSRDPGWVVAVSDATGRLIARTEDHAAYVGQISRPDIRSWSPPPEGVHRTTSMAGGALLRGYHWSEKSGWLIAAFAPSRLIDGPLARRWQLFALSGIATLLAALLLALQLGKRISAPIEAAAADARRLGQGEAIIPHNSTLLEANELSAALAAASSELRERSYALAQNEARFRSVFEQSAVGFKQVALDGRIVGINDRLCEMLGYTREECLAKTFKILTHPDDFESQAHLIDRLLSGEAPHYEIEKRLITKSGAPIWVRVTSAPVRDESGTISHFISVVEDVTESRRSRVAIARLAAIVQASQDAIIGASLTGDVETWNPGAEALFGYSSEEMIGTSLKRLLPSDRRDEFARKLAAVAKGETYKIETIRLHKDGTAIDVTATAAPISTNGTVTSMSVTMEDIRDRKRREAQVVLLNRELAHRVKNTLAVIQSIANQTVRSRPEPDAFRTAFQGRLQALAAANDLLMQTNWEGSDLDSFIDRQLSPLMPRAVRKLIKNGPHVVLPADLLIPLGLALHELGTNAVKYGAWSVETGQVKLSWVVKATDETTDSRRRLKLTWSELGGPAVQAVERRGFGATVIERGIPNATVIRTFDPEGVVCEIDVPLS